MKLKIPPKVSYILDILQRHGFEAYAVGGCVRDSVLAREPSDWDITTSARPEEVKACFRRTVDTGIAHGTVTVMLEEDGFEVTTYRIDGSYSDGRHPDHVTFTPSLAADLMRRDFTINAMAYNDTRGLVDLYGGMSDLQKKTIRCVGNPDLRFGEDALRVMRAVRFAAQLGFSIDPGTRDAVRRHAESLAAVSAERISAELVKLLESDHPEMTAELFRLGITAVILPEFDLCMETGCAGPMRPARDTVGEHTLRSLEVMPPDRILRLTALMHEFGKPSVRETDEFGWDHFPGQEAAGAAIADKVIRRLRMDNDTRKTVTLLIARQGLDPGPDAASVRKCMHLLGQEHFESFLALKWADLLADGGNIDEELRKINHLHARAELIRRHGDPLEIRDLAVNGTDLLEMGVSGKEIGTLLGRALELVLDDPGKNSRETLLSFLSAAHAGTAGRTEEAP